MDGVAERDRIWSFHIHLLLHSFTLLQSTERTKRLMKHMKDAFFMKESEAAPSRNNAKSLAPGGIPALTLFNKQAETQRVVIL